ncbi:MAG: (2Fe-2S)-binding protein [Candidatus Hydrogenedentes bacterium]|nr:(2Fe-2S)-binding protein [Candidatus Hydrogenedentota bacterium]
MARLTIDGRAVDAPEGATVMEAAAQAGIEIPALCHVDGVRPLTACMLCVVEDTATGRTFPSCSTAAADGMIIETDNEGIRAARREILQLLLSEHAGDCEAPCRRICPAALDVPLMMRRVAAGDLDEAAGIAREALIFPGTLGWVCSAPCERGCHRAAYDEPLLIRDMHRRLAERARIPADEPPLPSGKRVAIVGAGIAGLAAAWTLRRRGHGCRVFEKADRPGGPLRDLDEEALPWGVFAAEVDAILRLGVELETNCEVGKGVSLERLTSQYDAVLLACDDLEDDGENVFTAIELPMAVNSVAEGRDVAEEVDRFLRGIPEPPRRKAFDCRLGDIGEHEKAAFAAERLDPATVNQGRRPDAIEAEARRCLHCDCLKVVSCKLRRYATEYGAKQFAYREVRRPSIRAAQRTGDVVFEPGKCIRCGLCVEIAKQAGEALGLGFVGRGMDVRVAVPFARPLDEGLVTCARECAAACPTGALAVRDREERDS